MRIVQQMILVYKVCAKNEFFLEALYDLEFMCLGLRSKANLEGHGFEAGKGDPAGSLAEGRSISVWL